VTVRARVRGEGEGSRRLERTAPVDVRAYALDLADTLVVEPRLVRGRGSVRVRLRLWVRVRVRLGARARARAMARVGCRGAPSRARA